MQHTTLDFKLVGSEAFQMRTSSSYVPFFSTRHLEISGLLRRWSCASCGWETHEDLEAIVKTPF